MDTQQLQEKRNRARSLADEAFSLGHEHEGKQLLDYAELLRQMIEEMEEL